MGFESLKQNKLQYRVRDTILDEIMAGNFKDGKLPTETKLAKMLGVSRATISITLAYMEREGIVVRRHGSATYVNQGYKDIHSSINQGVGIYDLIKQNNYTPSLLSDNIVERCAGKIPEQVQKKLGLDSSDQIKCFQRVFGADGNPAVFVEEYIPEKYIVKPIEVNEFPETIYKLSEKYCVSPIEFTLVEIIPFVSDASIQNKLGCDANDPILLTEEIHLNNKSVPMVFSKVYLRDKYIRYQAIRIRK